MSTPDPADLITRLRAQARSSEEGILDENGCGRSDLSAAEALREAADYIEQSATRKADAEREILAACGELRVVVQVLLGGDPGGRLAVAENHLGEALVALAAAEPHAPSPEEGPDAPLWRMARKCWSKDGLTERDMAREGYRFKRGRDMVTLRVVRETVANEIGGGFDRVGPTLVAEFRRIFEPIPKG